MRLMHCVSFVALVIAYGWLDSIWFGLAAAYAVTLFDNAGRVNDFKRKAHEV